VSTFPRARASRWLLALLCTLAACGPPRPVQRAGWTGGQELEVLLRTDAAKILALTDLTAEVRFSLHEVGSASGSILFQPPTLMRLDVRDFLFRRILSAVLDGDRLLALSRGEHYEMPAAAGLDVFLQIDLGGYDPRLALLGVVAPGRLEPDATEYPRADRAIVQLYDGVEGESRRLWLDLHRGFVEREELLDANGNTRWSRQLSGWRRLADTDVYLPKNIRVESQGRILKLEYGELRLNRDLPRATFFSGLGDP